MLTSEENNDYWKMISDFSDEHEDTSTYHLRQLEKTTMTHPKWKILAKQMMNENDDG